MGVWGNPLGTGRAPSGPPGVRGGGGHSGRARRGWASAAPSRRGPDAVVESNASRLSGTEERELTTRSSLESDSELESSPLPRSR